MSVTVNPGTGTIYNPCDIGLHVVCSDGDDAAATVLNVSCQTFAEARDLFERAKTECAAGPDEPWDLVVDLNEARYEAMVDEFSMSRQMLARFCALCGVPVPSEPWQRTPTPPTA